KAVPACPGLSRSQGNSRREEHPVFLSTPSPLLVREDVNPTFVPRSASRQFAHLRSNIRRMLVSGSSPSTNCTAPQLTFSRAIWCCEDRHVLQGFRSEPLNCDSDHVPSRHSLHNQISRQVKLLVKRLESERDFNDIGVRSFVLSGAPRFQ